MVSADICFLEIDIHLQFLLWTPKIFCICGHQEHGSNFNCVPHHISGCPVCVNACAPAYVRFYTGRFVCLVSVFIQVLVPLSMGDARPPPSPPPSPLPGHAAPAPSSNSWSGSSSCPSKWRTVCSVPGPRLPLSDGRCPGSLAQGKAAACWHASSA